jgi:tetratricopeptide (TPR) repeat protein
VEVNRRAFKIQDELRKYDHQDKAAALYNLAKALSSSGQLAEAEERNRELVAMWMRLHGPEDRLVAMTRDNLGTVLVAEGKPDLAEQEHRQALELRRKLGDPDVPLTLNNLANSLIGQKKYSEAAQTLEESIAFQKQAGRSGELLANCFRTKAALQVRLGKIDDAEKGIRECLALCEADPVLRDSWRKFDAMSILGGVLVLRTNLDGAEPLLLSGNQGLQQRAEKLPAPARKFLHQALERLVQLYEAWGKPEQAAEWKNTLARLEPVAGPAR